MNLRIMMLVVVGLFAGSYVSANEGAAVAAAENVAAQAQAAEVQTGDMVEAVASETAVAPVAVNAGNKICPVSGEKVDGAMGEIGQYEYKGKIYNLCCKMCLKDFSKDPEKYSKIADDEVAKSRQ